MQESLESSAAFASAAEAANKWLQAPANKQGVTQEEVAEAAVRMAKAGYRMGPESVAALKAYLEGYGLLLGGGVGTGKTYFFDAIERSGIRGWMARIKRLPILRISALKLEDINEFMHNCREDEMLVDDIGSEPTYSNYGCRIELLPWIVETRMASPARTHFTTNLSASEIERRYGNRVADRIHEMCAGFLFPGKSMRTTRVRPALRLWKPEDWKLCEERCRFGICTGCSAGVATPPAKDPVRPHAPEECPKFAAL